MPETFHESSEFWMSGQCNHRACVIVDDYGYKVICVADASHLTLELLLNAVTEEFPGAMFTVRNDVSPGLLHAIGLRKGTRDAAS